MHAANAVAAAGFVERLTICTLLITLTVALAIQASELGVTVDEPSHLISSYRYWRGEDNLPPRDMPPLIKICTGWVPHLLQLPVPEGKKLSEWNAAAEMMDTMDIRRMQSVFFLCRLPLVAFSLLTLALLWWWARALFGPAVAMLVAVAYALEPTARGHGALLKNDIAAAFAYLLYWYFAWRFWREPRSGNSVGLALATLLAAITKMSLLFLVPLAPLLVLARYVLRAPISKREVVAGILTVVMVPYLGVLAAYQFDVRLLTSSDFANLWRDPRYPAPFLAMAQVFRVIPAAEGMWEGCLSLLASNAHNTPVYLLGKVLPGGSLFYFVVALAVKIPCSLQILLIGGSVVLVWRLVKKEAEGSWLFWLLPGVLYIALASMARLQLGVRLVLPALPFGLLLCGMALQWALRDVRRAAFVVVLFGWLTYRSFQIFPLDITYFNQWVGGPENGLRYLADSNLDWGQGLPDLADFARERGISRLHLSYFGFDNPFRYFSVEELDLVWPPWDDRLAKGDRLRPEPGYYAVSATLLPGHYFAPRYRDYYHVFRSLQPIGKAGNSIYVYKIGLN